MKKISLFQEEDYKMDLVQAFDLGNSKLIFVLFTKL